MSIYDFKVKNNEGKEVSLGDYNNKFSNRVWIYTTV